SAWVTVKEERERDGRMEGYRTRNLLAFGIAIRIGDSSISRSARLIGDELAIGEKWPTPEVSQRQDVLGP
ncbi:hypothetical protein HN011_006902, partial [Eciton burchellii]